MHFMNVYIHVNGGILTSQPTNIIKYNFISCYVL